MKHLMILAAVMSMVGCASRPDNRPVAARVCVDAPQETPEETAYLRKKAASYLKDYGFTLAAQQCDVTTRYHRLGAFQGEAVHVAPLWVSRSGYWSQEGMVTTTAADGLVLDEDRSVALRGYSTKQELLDQLAWKVVEPATWYYQPATPPK